MPSRVCLEASKGCGIWMTRPEAYIFRFPNRQHPRRISHPRPGANHTSDGRRSRASESLSTHNNPPGRLLETWYHYMLEHDSPPPLVFVLRHCGLIQLCFSSLPSSINCRSKTQKVEGSADHHHSRDSRTLIRQNLGGKGLKSFPKCLTHHCSIAAPLILKL